MLRSRPLLAAMLGLLGSAPLLAAPADPLALGAGHLARFDEKGVWRLESDKGTLLAQCGLRLWTQAAYLTQADARIAEPPAEGPAGRTFHGVLRVANKPVHYWQTATPVPNGLLVQYAVAADALAEADELAAGFELPLGTYSGGTASLPGAKPVPLPDAKSAEPRLIEQDATTLVLERNGLVLSLQRRPAGKIIIQDGRHWNNLCFQTHLYAVRAIGDPPGWRSISFLLTLGRPASGPLIAAVVPGKEAIPCHGLYEAEVHFWAPCENPYREAEVRLWADVTAPSGRQAIARGFFDRDYVRTREGDAEVLSPVGHARWRLRVAPTEPGVHSVTVHVASAAGASVARPLTFTASPSSRQRFLHPPRRQARYLEHSNGEPCFLIGHNYCWPSPKGGTYDLDAALARMAHSGVNATRLWLCSWGIRLEGSRPDDYRLDDAWRLDHILRQAAEHGIYVQLCLDNVNDLVAPENAARNPYLAQNGGPCAAPAQFFSLPKAQEQYRRRLDYLLARYAPYTSVLAWELFNEVGYATGKPHDPALLAWARDSAAYLKKADPYGHPVTIGVGLSAAWDELWRLPELDLVEAHAYIRRPIGEQKPSELDAAELMLEQHDALGDFGKPLLVAEFGFLGTREFNPLNEADRTGIHLHNALWACALGGCAGGAMNWWWDSYVAERDLYYHYAALANFLRDTPLPGPDWNPVRTRGKSPVLVLGFKSQSAALLWIQQRENTWYRRLIEQREPVTFERTCIDLPRLADGRYRVEWWDTYGGQLITHTVVPTADGTLTLRVPPRFPDVACKVRRVSD